MADRIPQTGSEIAEGAASVLAPEADLFEDLDAAGLAEALGRAVMSSMRDPVGPAHAAARLVSDLARIPLLAGTRVFGVELEPPVDLDPKDRRVSQPALATPPPLFPKGV